jgi:coproporphyrinogen III oxidase
LLIQRVLRYINTTRHKAIRFGGKFLLLLNLATWPRAPTNNAKSKRRRRQTQGTSTMTTAPRYPNPNHTRRRLAIYVTISLRFLLLSATAFSTQLSPAVRELRSSTTLSRRNHGSHHPLIARSAAAVAADEQSTPPSSPEEIFELFTQFIINHQTSMIAEIEHADGSGVTFSLDGWGAFLDGKTNDTTHSGGITRVIQGGNVVEKGACSLTIIRNGILTADRAATIRGRQSDSDEDDKLVVQEGDTYSAAALSVVLHTKNPFVPTFRSDVRIFLVKSSKQQGVEEDAVKSVAWFGGGSDLTPYYLIDQDIIDFHIHLKKMCDDHFLLPDNSQCNLSYRQMKQSCDEYFYLPARMEHRGTGGIFFDDLPATISTYEFVRDVAQGWMPSWLPIVNKNTDREYSEEEKHWQCLRRGRYLEFNLLYDRGVKFGLANANPRVEGVMVSAPPMIAFDYNYIPKVGSEEERLVKILKNPKDWV